MLVQTLFATGSGVGVPLGTPLQAFDPSAVVGAPAPIRATVALLSSVLTGGVITYRYGRRLDAAVAAARENFTLNLFYGLFAYALAGFLVAYGFAQIASLGVEAPLALLLALVVLGGALLLLGGIGYAIVGTWLASTTGLGDSWIGVVGVSLVGAAIVYVLPFFLGAALWFAIAAIGLGGPVRRWVHADAAQRTARS